MAYKSKDGREFSNRPMAVQHNTRLGSMAPDKSEPASQEAKEGEKDITSDPRAMQLVDELQKMGYTADDVAEAMGGQEQEMDQGKEATMAAPMQIPGT